MDDSKHDKAMFVLDVGVVTLEQGRSIVGIALDNSANVIYSDTFGRMWKLDPNDGSLFTKTDVHKQYTCTSQQ